MKKFYITSQSIVDIDNSIEVLVEGASIAECEDMQLTLVVFDNKKAAEVVGLLNKAGIPVDNIKVQNENTLRVDSNEVTLIKSASVYGVVFYYYPMTSTLVLKEGEYISRRRRNLER